MICLSGKFLITGSYDKTIKVWQLCDYSKAYPLLFLIKKKLNNVLYKKKFVLSIISSFKIDLASKIKCLRSLEGHETAIVSLLKFANNTRLASGSKDGIIKIWNVFEWSCINTFSAHNGWVWCLSEFVYTNILTIASGGEDGYIRLWNSSTFENLTVLKGHENMIRCIANINLTETNLLASGGRDNLIRLWNSEGGLVNVLKGHTYWIYSIIQINYQRGNKLIASGSLDKTIKLWDIILGTCLKTFIGHDYDISCIINLNVDKNIIASASNDNNIMLWDIEKGYCIKCINAHSNRVSCLLELHGSDKSSTLLSAGGDRVIKIWKINFK